MCWGGSKLPAVKPVEQTPQQGDASVVGAADAERLKRLRGMKKSNTFLTGPTGLDPFGAALFPKWTADAAKGKKLLGE
jgi:hypothetical protein